MSSELTFYCQWCAYEWLVEWYEVEESDTWFCPACGTEHSYKIYVETTKK